MAAPEIESRLCGAENASSRLMRTRLPSDHGSLLTAPVYQAGPQTRTGRSEITMTLLFTPSSAIHQNKAMLRARDELVVFVDRNADDLLWVGGAAGGHNGRAAAAELVDTVLSRPDDLRSISDLIIVLRDMLCASPASTNYASNNGRPDLDAAIRWLGARLDEFSVRFT